MAEVHLPHQVGVPLKVRSAPLKCRLVICLSALLCRLEELRSWAFLFMMRLLYHLGLAPDLQEISSIMQRTIKQLDNSQGVGGGGPSNLGGTGAVHRSITV